jgi:hypothetical protein
MKIILAVATSAAMLTTAPFAMPAKAQGVRIAQGLDIQVGPGRSDRRDYDRRYDSDSTVGVGPGGVTVAPRERCRIVTTTVEREDGRRVTRKERRCD